MNSSLKKLAFAGSFVFLLFSTVTISSKHNIAHGQAQQPTITTSDITSAGFSVTNQEMPQSGGLYQGPQVYFRVSDAPAGSSTTGNLVMVYTGALANSSTNSLYVYHNARHQPFTIQGGSGMENTLSDGRFAIDFIKDNMYGVVIAPAQQKAEALASSVASKL